MFGVHSTATTTTTIKEQYMPKSFQTLGMEQVETREGWKALKMNIY